MANLFGGIISLLSGNFVKDIGEAIDNNVTSTEERMKLHNELQEIAAKREAEGHRFAEAIEGNITQRHQADMQSDSKLAKNVRPAILVTLTTVTLVYITVPVFKELAAYSYKAWEVGLTTLVSLDMLVYGFYFGSRGVEKVATALGTLLRK